MEPKRFGRMEKMSEAPEKKTCFLFRVEEEEEKEEEEEVEEEEE